MTDDTPDDEPDTGATDTHDPDGVPYADHPGAIRELFARPVKGDGVLGDVGIGPDEEELAALVGKRVTAKRLGWDDDEDADPEYFLDHTPYSEMGYDSPDLTGVLSVLRFTLPDGTPGAAWAVGGQGADPKTVRPAG